VSKCKLWNPLRISSSIKIPHGCTSVIDGLCILGVPMGFQNFATHFLDEVLYQDVVHIEDTLVVYKPSLYARLCPIYFSKELGPGGFVFVL